MPSCSRNARQVGGNAHARNNMAHKAHGGARKRSGKRSGKRSVKRSSTRRSTRRSVKRSSTKRSSSKRSSRRRSVNRRRSRGGNPLQKMANSAMNLFK